MTYEKQDAIMTRGFAVLCMVVLHLFCRKGGDVFGMPLLWISDDTPLIYWFGFYSEICVSIYSICMGYAQFLLYDTGKATWKHRITRIRRLMVNYWIILVLFSLAGLMVSAQHVIPGSLSEFLQSLILIHSYNGAWWFLNTYILFLLIPSSVKFAFVKKMKSLPGLILCILLSVFWYAINRFGLWPAVSVDRKVLSFILKELHNLCSVLPAVWSGAFLCKGNILPEISAWFSRHIQYISVRKLILWLVWALLFVVMNLLHKAAATIVFAILSFILFNVLEKSPVFCKVFSFFGFHSTNIWLSHMFFYSVLFTGLVQRAKYPLFMLAFMLVLCISTSYVEKLIEKTIYRSFRI